MTANEAVHPLRGLTVADLSYGIAGGYAAKLLSDAGAAVVKIEDADGDNLRWRSFGSAIAPLYAHLHSAHEVRSVDLTDAASFEEAKLVVAEADIVITGADDRLPDAEGSLARVAEARGSAAVVAQVSPFGATGPLANAAANEFVLQARSGKLTVNFEESPELAPAVVGGEPGLWLAGAFVALAAVAYQRLAAAALSTIELDISIFEAMVTAFGQEAMGVQLDPNFPRGMRSVGGYQIPGIHPTSDGSVALGVVTAQQWADFCVLIEQPEWIERRDLASAAGRAARAAEVIAAIEDWTTAHTGEEVLERASLFRVPAGVLANGSTTPTLAGYQGFFTTSGTGFLRPGPAVHFRNVSDSQMSRATPPAIPCARPLDGLRVADFTAFWAGPHAGGLLALLGAEVVHIESPKRPDGMRARSVRPPTDPTWLEWSSTFHANNGSKLAVSIDLDDSSGREIARSLIARCDGLLENFSPRVMEHFGLDFAGLAEIRSDLVVARMPAFGLDNPWRDRPAFQHTIEPMAGIAWVTGHPDGHPQPGMVTDALAGVHAAFGMVCGFHGRDTTGRGVHVEIRLAEVAAAVAAEATVAASAGGVVIERIGNRTRWGWCQGLFRCRPDGDADHHWVAISAETAVQWHELASAVGLEPLVDPTRTRHDEDVERVLAEWCSVRTAGEVLARLQPCVPAARVHDPWDVLADEQLAARSFFTMQKHDACGALAYPGLPFQARLAHEPLPTGHRAPAPCWAQHDRELARLAGVDASLVRRLEALGVLGRHAVGTPAM